MTCARTKLIGLSKCSPQRVELMTDFTSSSSGGSMDMACGDYTSETDKCDRLGKCSGRYAELVTNSWLHEVEIGNKILSRVAWENTGFHGM